MKKTYILDTSVLLHDANALTSFEDNDVVIPDVVLEEMNKHKRDRDSRGVNAIQASKILEKYRQDGADFIKGYELPTGGSIRIEMNCINTKMPSTWEPSSDNRILRVSKGLAEKMGNDKVILVSNNTFMRLKASVLGLKAQEYLTDRVLSMDSIYQGERIVFAKEEDLQTLFNDKYLDYSKIFTVNDETGESASIDEPILNEYFCIKSIDGSTSALTYYDGESIKLLKNVNSPKNQKYPSGIIPKTLSQKFLVDALMRSSDDASLVIAKGPAGTGKTLLSIAAGLEGVMNGTYRKVLYLRGNVLLDEDIGFLPGTENEKLDWILRPVKDNLEVIFNQKFSKEDYSSYSSNKHSHSNSDSEDKNFLNRNTQLQDMVQEIFDRNYIEVEAIGHMRGRSICDTMVIIDEAQNLTPNQVTTLITRYNTGSKIVLLGDPLQIDSSDLDINNNGLTFASDRMAGAQNTFQITLNEEECKRPVLCLEAIKRMAKKNS